MQAIGRISHPVLAGMLAGSYWTGEQTYSSPPPFTGRYQLHHLSLLLFYLISALILYRPDGDLRSTEKINNLSSPLSLFFRDELQGKEKDHEFQQPLTTIPEMSITLI